MASTVCTVGARGETDVKNFEMKFPRSDAKPCEPFSAYITKEIHEAGL